MFEQKKLNLKLFSKKVIFISFKRAKNVKTRLTFEQKMNKKNANYIFEEKK